jgi:hypothetical protein
MPATGQIMTKRPSLAESMKAMATASAPALSDARPEPPRSAPISAPIEARKFHAATREGLKKVTTAVEPSRHKQLKRLAVDQDKSVEDLLREAIDDLLTKYA